MQINDRGKIDESRELFVLYNNLFFPLFFFNFFFTLFFPHNTRKHNKDVFE